MKPTDPVSLYNWEALNVTCEKEAMIIKKRMEDAWKKKYNKD